MDLIFSEYGHSCANVASVPLASFLTSYEKLRFTFHMLAAFDSHMHLWHQTTTPTTKKRSAIRSSFDTPFNMAEPPKQNNVLNTLPSSHSNPLNTISSTTTWKKITHPNPSMHYALPSMKVHVSLKTQNDKISHCWVFFITILTSPVTQTLSPHLPL
jgi:hypothetical protein